MSATMHPFAPEEIMALLDGELPADRAQSVSAHVEICHECGMLAKELKSAKQELSSWKIGTLPVSIVEHVYSVVEKIPPPSGATGPS